MRNNKIVNKLVIFGYVNYKNLITVLFYVGIIPIIYQSFIFIESFKASKLFLILISDMDKVQTMMLSLNYSFFEIIVGILFAIVCIVIWKVICELIYLIFRALDTNRYTN